jgi:hypothetical protein
MRDFTRMIRLISLVVGVCFPFDGRGQSSPQGDARSDMDGGIGCPPPGNIVLYSWDDQQGSDFSVEIVCTKDQVYSTVIKQSRNGSSKTLAEPEGRNGRVDSGPC